MLYALPYSMLYYAPCHTSYSIPCFTPYAVLPQKERKVSERNTRIAWCKFIRATTLSRKDGWEQNKGRDGALAEEPTLMAEERSGPTMPTPESYRAFVEWKEWRQLLKE